MLYYFCNEIFQKQNSFIVAVSIKGFFKKNKIMFKIL